MHRSLRVLSTSALAVGATAATAVPAGAATKAKLPVVRSASPMSLAIGQTLTLRGTALKAGKARTTVVFQRTGGTAVFARASKATSTSITVVVPPALQAQLPLVKGVATPVRFQLRVLTRRFSKGFTAPKISPVIGPVRAAAPTLLGGAAATPTPAAVPAPAPAAAPTTTENRPVAQPAPPVTAPDQPGGTATETTPALTPSVSDPAPVLTTPAPDPTPAPCITTDPKLDSDSDLLDNGTEAKLRTDPCNADTDGDGMTDGWEQLSAIDRNGEAVPSPLTRPYPNALDRNDANVDQDGDGLTNLQEFAAWDHTGRKLAAVDTDRYTSRLTYSGGDPTSAGRSAPIAAVDAAKYADYLSYADQDHNGFLSDLERDADGDGLPNVDEGVGLSRIADDGATGPFTDVGLFSPEYIRGAAGRGDSATECGGINRVPYFCPTIDADKVDALDWLNQDSDGDGTIDGADDVDHDDVANLTEYRQELKRPLQTREYAQVNACFPYADSRFCLVGDGDIDGDGIPNGDDADADGDGLTNLVEQQIGTRSLLADTDGDEVTDGFEQQSAIDLNSQALPYPAKRPFPNALDGSDATTDFDGDGLDLHEEQAAWIADGAPRPLTYSDGTQNTGGTRLTDGDKDVDADGISNWIELHGPGQPGWWAAAYPDETPYVSRTFTGLDFTDRDTDGDGLIDGLDDEDHDGFTNAQELRRPSDWASTYVSTTHNGTSTRARVNPFNPCKPFYSSKCHLHPPFDAYPETEDWASPVFADGP